jgi:hypothetical protein
MVEVGREVVCVKTFNPSRAKDGEIVESDNIIFKDEFGIVKEIRTGKNSGRQIVHIEINRPVPFEVQFSADYMPKHWSVVP